MFLDERVDVSGIEIENVVAVRYECTQKGSGNKWPSMREFKVSTTPETGVEFTKEVIRTQDGWAPYQGEESNLIDENTQISIWYNVRQNGNPANTTIKGDYVGVKLSQPITLGKIDILQGKNGNDGDYFKNVKLQYSVNGTDWKDIPVCICLCFWFWDSDMRGIFTCSLPKQEVSLQQQEFFYCFMGCPGKKFIQERFLLLCFWV